MEPPRAVNKIAPPLYLKSIRNIFEIFLFNMFFTTVSSRLNLAEVKWLKSTAPRNRGVVEPMPFSKLLVRILVQGVCYIWPPGAHFKEKKSNKPKEVTSKLKMVSAIAILLEYIHCSSDLHEEQVKSGRVGCYSCPDAKTVRF